MPHVVYTAIPAGYYYEDNDEYVGDYVESDAFSETPRSMPQTIDITEVYRCKQPARQIIHPPLGPYHHDLHPPRG